MKSKILGMALFAITLAVVAYYPHLQAKTIVPDATPNIAIDTGQTPKIDVVFVLDTTGSMGGLIQTAKEKIWAIASTMASAQPTPELRIGLVAYRDRGDAYVTRVVDLSDDLDSVYATLMDFQADGGGDGPEAVNKALYDAVHEMSWSSDGQVYRSIFLVGDAPPHMDYNEVQYADIVAAAAQKGIVVNTIQCGEMAATALPWTQIASLGNGSFFQVEQAGGAVAYSTPYDVEIAELSAKLDETRLYYGSKAERERMDAKMAATEIVVTGSSVESLARRGAFNASEGGRKNMLGEQELVAAVTDGAVKLEDIERDQLPEALKPMAPEEQEAFVQSLAEDRAELKRKIRQLAKDRNEFIASKVAAEGGAEDSLDYQFYEAVKEQAEVAGFEYSDGPAY